MVMVLELLVPAVMLAPLKLITKLPLFTVSCVEVKLLLTSSIEIVLAPVNSSVVSSLTTGPTGVLITGALGLMAAIIFNENSDVAPKLPLPKSTVAVADILSPGVIVTPLIVLLNETLPEPFVVILTEPK